MAEKIRYPQIPSTVWWGVRAILQKTPNVTIDDRLLGVQLGVQEAAARAYIIELKSVGLLNEDGKPTPLAQKWRLDESYADAAKQIIENIYPENLRSIAPPESGDRQKVVSWFQREGLGSGAAGNKAATYLLMGSPSPNEAPNRGGGRPATSGDSSGVTTSARRNEAERKAKPTASSSRSASPSRSQAQRNRGEKGPETIPLNVNVQIHISADAGSDQIEAIFSAMKRYLYDSSN